MHASQRLQSTLKQPQIADAKKAFDAAKKGLKAKQAALQATLAEAEAADGERASLGEALAAAKKGAKELEKQVQLCAWGWLELWIALSVSWAVRLPRTRACTLPHTLHPQLLLPCRWASWPRWWPPPRPTTTRARGAWRSAWRASRWAARVCGCGAACCRAAVGRRLLPAMPRFFQLSATLPGQCLPERSAPLPLQQECDAEINAAGKELDALEGRRTDLVVEKKRLGAK